MATNLTKKNITDAQAAVAKYKAVVEGYYSELNSAITTLTQNDFIGDASEGYRTFYTSKVVPVLTTNLTADQTSLMSKINTVLGDLEQLLATVDPNLKKDIESLK